MDKINFSENDFLELKNKIFEEKKDELYFDNKRNFRVLFAWLLVIFLPAFLVLACIIFTPLEKKEVQATILIFLLAGYISIVTFSEKFDQKIKKYAIFNSIKNYFEFKNIDSQKVWEDYPEEKFEIYVKKISDKSFIVYDKASLNEGYDYINMVDKEDINDYLYNVLKGKHMTAKELESSLNKYMEDLGQELKDNYIKEKDIQKTINKLR